MHQLFPKFESLLEAISMLSLANLVVIFNDFITRRQRSVEESSYMDKKSFSVEFVKLIGILQLVLSIWSFQIHVWVGETTPF